jgi:hypothetical protein
MIALAASAEEPSSFRISQAAAHLPQITAWLEVLTPADQFVSDVAANQVTASIGARSARIVSLTPFMDSGEGVASLLLVDISKSLKPAQFVKMREALLAWVDAMTEKDRTAVMTFGTEVHQLMDFSEDKVALKEAISRLGPTDAHTQLHRGLVEAMSIKNRMDPDIPMRRIIITLSDGRDDYVAGLRREEVLAAMQTDRIPLYAIGFSVPPVTPQKEADLKKLGEFARASGGALLKAGDTSFTDKIAQLQERVLRVHVAQVICDTCEADNALHRLQINLTAGQRVFTDGLDIRLIRAPSAEPVLTPIPPEPSIPTGPPISVSPRPARWPYLAGGGLVLLVLITGLVLWRRRKKIAVISPESLLIKAAEAVGDTPDNEFTKEKEMSPIWSSFSENDTRPIDDEQIVPGLRLRLTPIGVHPSFTACEVVLADRLILGRSSSQCAVYIPGDEKISRQHCELIRKDDTMLVRDLNTTNGTRVNGIQISGLRRLEPDDILLLGRTELRISILPPTPVSKKETPIRPAEPERPKPEPPIDENRWNIQPSWMQTSEDRPYTDGVPHGSVGEDQADWVKFVKPQPINFDDDPAVVTSNPSEINRDSDQAKPPSKSPSGNFFLKLSRGEFGLAKTYWVYGFAVGIVLEIGSRLIAYSRLEMLHIIYICSCIMYNILVTKGIWLAASAYTGKKRWAVLAKIAVVFGVILIGVALVGVVVLIMSI